MLDEELPLSTYYLAATDLDRGALQRARERGPFTVDEVKNMTHEQRTKYMREQKGFYVSENIARRVTFKEQNLLEDRFEKDFDLIVCRNVVIYFTNEAKSLLYAKFHAALKPGGILFVGGTEIIPRPQEFGFRNFGISFYEKVDR
jgi:chemotaxis protein methyltransferase CheR